MDPQDFDAGEMVAAGLLAADDALDPAPSVDVATERLRRLLSPAAVWTSAPLAAEDLDKPGWQRLGPVPRWQFPSIEPTDELTATVRSAWAAALPPPAWQWGNPVLRLEVDNCEDARRLQSLDKVGPYLLVPVVAGQYPHVFYWRWPLRVAIAPGPYSAAWLEQLEHSRYGELFEARIADQAEETPLDLLLVGPDGSAPQRATCVLLVDAVLAPEELLARGRERFRAAAIMGVQRPDLQWFDSLVQELAHDQPIDVALRVAVPDALIEGNAGFLAWTAARQWAIEVQDELSHRLSSSDAQSPVTELRRLTLTAGFDAERKGTTQLVRVIRSFESVGRRIALEKHFAMAAAPPRPEPPLRSLIAEVTVRGKKRTTSLAPKAKHQFNVWIAIPQEGDLVADQPLPEHELPAGELVPLTVHVACDAIGLHASQDIYLSMIDRSAPSTVAAFEFHTGEEGSVLDIKVLVTHRSRPLQEVHLVASVRAKAVSADRIRLLTVPLSASPVPLEETSEAKTSLEVNGANLESSGTNRKVDMSRLRPTIDLINNRASTVLAGDDAPEALDAPAARKLLVDLARLGAQLKRELSPLGIAEEGTLSLLVDATSDVVPLELAYDADAPDELLSEMCEHKLGGKRVGEQTMCSDAGTKVVCPLAFWGQRRTIARTIRFAPDREIARGRAMTPIKLRPVLYAAATRADEDAPGAIKPTQYLAEQIMELLGPENVLRVNTWDDWRDAVRDHRPQLLVVLGHTESARGEMILEIGKDSWLKDPDVHADVLQAEGAPKPLVLLLACSTAVSRNPFGGLPAAFTAGGAAAVVATLTKMHGPHAAKAAAAVIKALLEASASGDQTLGAALTVARRRLVQEGLLDGLLLVSHGEIDMVLKPARP
jgi:hypothetical protein